MKLQDLLENYPSARERRNKWRAIACILKRRYRLEIPDRIMASLLSDASSLSREWRRLLQENESLRGRDYYEKKVLEQAKQIDLGYEGGYSQKAKRLQRL